MNSVGGLINVLGLLKIQMRTIIYWYLIMLRMEIYIIICQKISKKLPGKIKFNHFRAFQKGKVLTFYYSTINIDHIITMTSSNFTRII